MEKNDWLESLFGNKSEDETRKDACEKYRLTPENMSNWLPKIAVAESILKSSLKMPNTLIIPLGIEEFTYLTDDKNKKENIQKLNEFLKKKVGGFEKGKELFMKTGVFSNKFDFKTCNCGLDRDNLGKKLHEMYYMSMTYGAHESSEVVFREHIKDVEGRKEIYNGMPLHTEFRVFYDFDKKNVVGISNYWHPDMMTESSLKEDYANYEVSRDLLVSEYEQFKKMVANEVDKMMKDVEGLEGRWSVDVMKNGEDFWMIDMARMERSALVNYMETLS